MGINLHRLKSFLVYLEQILHYYISSGGVDVNKRTVTTHSRTACDRVWDLATLLVAVYFLSLILATSRPKLRFARIECIFQSFPLRFSCKQQIQPSQVGFFLNISYALFLESFMWNSCTRCFRRLIFVLRISWRRLEKRLFSLFLPPPTLLLHNLVEQLRHKCAHFFLGVGDKNLKKKDKNGRSY